MTDLAVFLGNSTSLVRGELSTSEYNIYEVIGLCHGLLVQRSTQSSISWARGNYFLVFAKLWNLVENILLNFYKLAFNVFACDL